jgi:hypothetical protein
LEATVQTPSTLFATYFFLDFAWWEPVLWWVGIVGGSVLVYVWWRRAYLLAMSIIRRFEETHGDHE